MKPYLNQALKRDIRLDVKGSGGIKFHLTPLVAAPAKMAEFLSLAVETLGNAEVSEANAEEVEAKVLSNAECVLRGLRLLKEEEQRKAIGFFLAKPLFTAPGKIESALMSVWGTGNYAELRGIYEGDSKHR